jgi:hypothetical protein
MEENTLSLEQTKSYQVSPHPLSGTRQRANDFLWELPEDLSEATVTVDASEMKAYAHCFVDELCKQIVQVRNAQMLIIRSDSEKLRQQVTSSAQLRRFPDRVSFV